MSLFGRRDDGRRERTPEEREKARAEREARRRARGEGGLGEAADLDPHRTGAAAGGSAFFDQDDPYASAPVYDEPATSRPAPFDDDPYAVPPPPDDAPASSRAPFDDDPYAVPPPPDDEPYAATSAGDEVDPYASLPREEDPYAVPPPDDDEPHDFDEAAAAEPHDLDEAAAAEPHDLYEAAAAEPHEDEAAERYDVADAAAEEPHADEVAEHIEVADPDAAEPHDDGDATAGPPYGDAEVAAERDAGSLAAEPAPGADSPDADDHGEEPIAADPVGEEPMSAGAGAGAAGLVDDPPPAGDEEAVAEATPDVVDEPLVEAAAPDDEPEQQPATAAGRAASERAWYDPDPEPEATAVEEPAEETTAGSPNGVPGTGEQPVVDDEPAEVHDPQATAAYDVLAEEPADTGDHELADDTGGHEVVGETGDHEVVGETGDHEVVGETGDHELVDETGDHELVDETGDHELVGDTGDHELVEDTGEHEFVDDTGDHPVAPAPAPPTAVSRFRRDRLEPSGGRRRGLLRRGRRAEAEASGPLPAGRPRPPVPPGRRASATGDPDRPRRSRVGVWIVRIVAALALVSLIVAGWFLVSLYQPFAGEGGDRVRVRIPSGLTAREIGDLLEERGVVDSGFFFSLRARVEGKRDQLKAGTLTFREDMPYVDAIDVLVKGPPPIRTTTLTLPEGNTVRDFAEAVDDSGKVEGSYMRAVNTARFNPRRYGASDPDNLEGFLFPSTYELRRSQATAKRLVALQLATFEERFDSVSMRRARRANLTPYEVLIIASMVERETAVPRERRLIAGVIYNRLREGIPLGIDATIRYATNNWRRPIRESELQEAGPYNTRLTQGLPPTPIGNPGIASIRAAANPARTDYLFFVVKPGGDGEHAFAETLEEHNQNVARYDEERTRRGGQDPSSGE